MSRGAEISCLKKQDKSSFVRKIPLKWCNDDLDSVYLSQSRTTGRFLICSFSKESGRSSPYQEVEGEIFGRQRNAVSVAGSKFRYCSRWSCRDASEDGMESLDAGWLLCDVHPTEAEN